MSTRRVIKWMSLNTLEVIGSRLHSTFFWKRIIAVVLVVVVVVVVVVITVFMSPSS